MPEDEWRCERSGGTLGSGFRLANVDQLRKTPQVHNGISATAAELMPRSPGCVDRNANAGSRWSRSDCGRRPAGLGRGGTRMSDKVLRREGHPAGLRGLVQELLGRGRMPDVVSPVGPGVAWRISTEPAAERLGSPVLAV